MIKKLTLKEIQNIETDMLRTLDKICVENNINYYLVCGSVLGAIRHQGPIPWDYDVDITVSIDELDRFCHIMKKQLLNSNYKLVIPEDSFEKDNITTFPRMIINNVDPRKIHIDVFPQIGITGDVNEQKIFVEDITKIKNKYRNKKKLQSSSSNILKTIGKRIISIFYINIDSKKIYNEFKNLCKKYPIKNSEFVTNPCGHYKYKNILPKDIFGKAKRIKYLDMMLPVPEKTEEYLEHYYGNYMEFPSDDYIKKQKSYVVNVEVK